MNTVKKAAQPEALGPYNPTAGYLLDVNSGNKASICCLYEVGTEAQRQGSSHIEDNENKLIWQTVTLWIFNNDESFL